MKIDVWVPDFAGATGGIQTFSYFLVHGLKDSFPDAELTVFAKNDRCVPPADELNVARFHATGTWPAWQRTTAFTLALLTHTLWHRPDLIIIAHINFVPVAYLAQKFLGIPYWAIGHGVEVWKKPNFQVKTALRNAAKLMAVSSFTRARMSEVLELPVDKIDLLPDTFDPADFMIGPKPRFLLKRYGLRPEQPVILTIARLASEERYKGYDQILQALLDIRERFPDVCYLLGGRGPDRLRLEGIVSRLGLEKNVVFAGYIRDDELTAHYNLCDVFAMPSKGEGFGIVFLEASACGKPVVAGNKDGSADALLNGKLGMLVDPDNRNQIAAAIIQILSTQQTPGILCDPAMLRQLVIEAYGYPRFVERLKQLVGPMSQESRK